jgi:predicted Zn-ribbon and HTH transcriptional regulator
MDSILNKKNRVKRDYSKLPPVRKDCQSCFEEYETVVRWSKRCPKCKKNNSPYRKQIVNKDLKSPF